MVNQVHSHKRDRHLEMITEQGRLAWQKATDYGQRSLVETTMGRYKALIEGYGVPQRLSRRALSFV